MATQEDFVVLMTLRRGVDESIIPGVLASSGIPIHVSERYLARQGHYVEIRVPVSRLGDARRVLEDAKRAETLSASEASDDQEEVGMAPFGRAARRKTLLTYSTLWTLGTVVLSMLNKSVLFTATCLVGWSVFWIVLFYRGNAIKR